MEVIVKNYEHYNRSLKKYIRTKRDYNNEMKKQGMVSFEKGQDIAKRAKEKNHKDYKPTNETVRFLKEINHKNGKVKLSGRQLEYMEKIGVNFKRPEYLGTEGGWK